jgi:hypothetical protein
MATVGQFVHLGPINEAVGGGWKLYHYEAGTVTLKNLWTDRAKTTTAAQPVVADSRGHMDFFGDGLYDFVLKDANDNTLDTWENVFVGDASTVLHQEGAALPSASTVALGSDGDYFHVTGTNAIAALSGTQGFVILTFDSTPSLTDSSVFQLRNRESRQARTNETVLFVNDGGGTFREVAPVLRLANNTYLTGRNAAGTAEVDIIRVTSSNTLQVPTAIQFDAAVTFNTWDLNGTVGTLDADADTTFSATTDDQPVLAMGVGGFATDRTSDSRTNSVDVVKVYESTTSGTPAAGMGVAVRLDAESADESPSEFGQVGFVADDVGAGTEDTRFTVWTRVAGAALTRIYDWVATTAFKGVFTHANSADRTYTLPNFDGTVATLAGTEVFTNKTVSATSNSLALNVQSSTASYTDQTAEQTVYTYTLPGGSLGTTKGVRVTVLLNLAVGIVYTWRLKYGGTTLCTLTTSGVQTGPVWLQFFLLANGATNAQRGTAVAAWQDSTPAEDIRGLTATGTAAVDSTADQAIVFTQAQNVTGSSNSKQLFLVEPLS